MDLIWSENFLPGAIFVRCRRLEAIRDSIFPGIATSDDAATQASWPSRVLGASIEPTSLFERARPGATLDRLQEADDRSANRSEWSRRSRDSRARRIHGRVHGLWRRGERRDARNDRGFRADG